MENQRFDRVHPKHLIVELQKTGALRIIPQHPFLNRLINFTDHSKAIDKDTAVKTPGERLYDQIIPLPNKNEFISESIEKLKQFSEEEELGIDFESSRVKVYLEREFSKVHSRYYAGSSLKSLLARFFKNLGVSLGLLPSAKKICENVAKVIEKINILAVKDRYAGKISSARNINSLISKKISDLDSTNMPEPPSSQPPTKRNS